MGKTESHFRWQGAAPGGRWQDVSIQSSIQPSVICHLSSVIDSAIDLFQLAAPG